MSSFSLIINWNGLNSRSLCIVDQITYMDFVGNESAPYIQIQQGSLIFMTELMVLGSLESNVASFCGLGCVSKNGLVGILTKSQDFSLLIALFLHRFGFC